MAIDISAGKHWRGTGGAAPASDAATRRGCCCPRVRPRRATWIPRGFHRRELTRLQRASTWAKSGRLGPESAVSAETAETADSGRNSKKKKKKKNPERTVLLNTNPTSAQFHSKCQNTLLTFRLTHFVSVLSASLFRLPLCLSASVSSPLLHQYILSSALSHAFLTQVCFQS